MRQLIVRAGSACPLFTKLATFGLALAFIFGCSEDKDDGGSVVPVVPIPGAPVNYGGETYQTVVIGSQTWIARNLNYNASGSECYNNDPANCITYGRLYDWATAMKLEASCNTSICTQVASQHQGICPSGWHLPSDTEWNVLMTVVGGYSTAGKYLKARIGWYEANGNSNGTDDYGFSALPSRGIGYRDYGYWWSSSENFLISSYAFFVSMTYFDYKVERTSNSKRALHSVRCLKD